MESFQIKTNKKLNMTLQDGIQSENEEAVSPLK